MISENKKLIEYYVKVLLKEEGMLGKYVWPSAVGPSMPNEKDTEVEEMLYLQLHNHFTGKAAMSEEAVNVIKQILDSGEYSNVFVRRDEGPIVRGMRLPLSWLEKYAPEALEDLPVESKDPTDWGEPVSITPHIDYKSAGNFGSVSSWTSRWDKARNFTVQWSPDTVPVILHSNCNTGYFMSSLPFRRFKGGRYKEDFGIKKLNPNAFEMEILLFGSCKVSAVEVFLTRPDLEKMRLESKNRMMSQL